MPLNPLYRYFQLTEAELDLVEELTALSPSSGEGFVYDGSNWTVVTRGLLRGVETETTSPYTLVLDDLGKLKTMTFESHGTVTIPTNGSVAFLVGSQIPIVRGSASIGIEGADGVTVLSAGDVSTIEESNGFAYLVKVAEDTWRIAVSG